MKLADTVPDKIKNAVRIRPRVGDAVVGNTRFFVWMLVSGLMHAPGAMDYVYKAYDYGLTKEQIDDALYWLLLHLGYMGDELENLEIEEQDWETEPDDSWTLLPGEVIDENGDVVQEASEPEAVHEAVHG